MIDRCEGMVSGYKKGLRDDRSIQIGKDEGHKWLLQRLQWLIEGLKGQ